MFLTFAAKLSVQLFYHFLSTSVNCSVDSFKQFITDYLDGKIQAFVKSEDVPSDNDGPVKVDESPLLSSFFIQYFANCKMMLLK